MPKSNLFKVLSALSIILILSLSVFLTNSTEEIKDILLGGYANKIINLTIFYIFTFGMLRAADFILHREFKKQNFFDNDIAAGIYFAIRFLGISIGSALILM